MGHLYATLQHVANGHRSTISSRATGAGLVSSPSLPQSGTSDPNTATISKIKARAQSGSRYFLCVGFRQWPCCWMHGLSGCRNYRFNDESPRIALPMRTKPLCPRGARKPPVFGLSVNTRITGAFFNSLLGWCWVLTGFCGGLFVSWSP